MYWCLIIFTLLFSQLAGAVSSVGSNEKFEWTTENLNTLVAMGCSERYSRVFNQNDPEEFLVYDWQYRQQGNKTIVTGYCGMRFNSQYKIIEAPEINFVFDQDKFNASDDLMIEGRVGTFGIRFYFKTRSSVDADGKLVFVKTLQALAPMNTLGLEIDSYLRKVVPLLESAIDVSEKLHGHSTFRGIWSSSRDGRTNLEGENDRFAMMTGVFAKKERDGIHRILYRKSDMIRNKHRMDSTNDKAEGVFMSLPYLNRYRGCSYFNDRGQQITQGSCEEIIAKVHF